RRRPGVLGLRGGRRLCRVQDTRQSYRGTPPPPCCRRFARTNGKSDFATFGRLRLVSSRPRSSSSSSSSLGTASGWPRQPSVLDKSGENFIDLAAVRC